MVFIVTIRFKFPRNGNETPNQKMDFIHGYFYRSLPYWLKAEMEDLAAGVEGAVGRDIIN